MSDRKSVVEIDVQDGAWKSFAGWFATFSTNLNKAVDGIREAILETEKLRKVEAAKDKEEATAAAAAKKARVEKERAARTEAEAARKKKADQKSADDQRRKNQADDIKALKESAKWTADIAKNVASTAYSAAKWVAFSAIASGFGLGALANSAAGARQSALRLGINTGSLRAANVNFGKYIDAEGALSNIQSLKSDARTKWVFNQTGVNPDGGNAA